MKRVSPIRAGIFAAIRSLIVCAILLFGFMGCPGAGDSESADPPIKIYWIDWGTNTIKRANMDGSGVQAIVSAGLNNLEDIVVDPVEGKLYWTDSGDHIIMQANSDGSNVQPLASSLSTPMGIDLLY